MNKSSQPTSPATEVLEGRMAVTEDVGEAVTLNHLTAL